MKKTILFSVIFMMCNACIDRTPEKILKTQFNIDINIFDYAVDTFDESWNKNGDGSCFIKFKINQIHQEGIDYLINMKAKPLPVSDSMALVIHKIQKVYSTGNHAGYYLYDQEISDPRNFKLFVFDVENKEAILYYQIL